MGASWFEVPERYAYSTPNALRPDRVGKTVYVDPITATQDCITLGNSQWLGHGTAVRDARCRTKRFSNIS